MAASSWPERLNLPLPTPIPSPSFLLQQLESDEYFATMARSYPAVDVIITSGRDSVGSEVVAIDGRERLVSLGNTMRGCGKYTPGETRVMVVRMGAQPEP